MTRVKEMMVRVIEVAKEFSKFPFGRYRTQGKFSGEAFREDVLLPAMRVDGPVLVDLDGTSGVGPSFLEEAFGGLVRAGFTADQIFGHFRFKSDDDPSYIDELKGYVREAVPAI